MFEYKSFRANSYVKLRCMFLLAALQYVQGHIHVYCLKCVVRTGMQTLDCLFLCIYDALKKIFEDCEQSDQYNMCTTEFQHFKTFNFYDGSKGNYGFKYVLGLRPCFL